MEKKINLVELLKDCPKGMELDCVMYEDASFAGITENLNFPIRVKINVENVKGGNWTKEITLTSEGKLGNHPNAKCIIFPKGKTTWEGFIPPCKFKDGDIVTNIEGAVIIYKGITTCGYCGSFVSLDHYNQFIPHYQSYLTDTIRFATDDEKAKLFQAIKDNGYKWDTENKTLETLVTEKFDINTLVPFESRVLVRDSKNEKWRPAIWGFCDETIGFYPFEVVGGQMGFTFCIPYEGNEHLLGTTEDCEGRYKLWLS